MQSWMYLPHAYRPWRSVRWRWGSWPSLDKEILNNPSEAFASQLCVSKCDASRMNYYEQENYNFLPTTIEMWSLFSRIEWIWIHDKTVEECTSYERYRIPILSEALIVSIGIVYDVASTNRTWLFSVDKISHRDSEHTICLQKGRFARNMFVLSLARHLFLQLCMDHYHFTWKQYCGYRIVWGGYWLSFIAVFNIASLSFEYYLASVVFSLERYSFLKMLDSDHYSVKLFGDWYFLFSPICM